MNLPNAITVGRIFLVPLLVVVLLTKFEGRLIFGVQKELVGAAIFGLASLTDWLDGYLARRRQQVTTLGQFMDPLADKLLITAALVSLVQMDLAQSWMVVVILARELLVTSFRGLGEGSGQNFGAAFSGKLKMVFQSITILVILVYVNYLKRLSDSGYLEWATWLRDICIWATVAITVISGLLYLRRAPDLYRVGMDASPK